MVHRGPGDLSSWCRGRYALAFPRPCLCRRMRVLCCALQPAPHRRCLLSWPDAEVVAAGKYDVVPHDLEAPVPVLAPAVAAIEDALEETLGLLLLQLGARACGSDAASSRVFMGPRVSLPCAHLSSLVLTLGGVAGDGGFAVTLRSVWLACVSVLETCLGLCTPKLEAPHSRTCAHAVCYPAPPRCSERRVLGTVNDLTGNRKSARRAKYVALL